MTLELKKKSGMTGKFHSEATRKKMAEAKGKELYRARLAGEKFYFTGIACKNDHVSNRYVSTGMCIDCVKQQAKKWAKSNKPKMSCKSMKRHADKLQRTPQWLNAGHLFEIECMYKYCGALRSIGLNYHVDHIVPLKGKNVSGMHVPWNLQVIYATENLSKGNKHHV